MSAYVKTIKDKSGDTIYPQTKVEAIYDNENVDLQTLLDAKGKVTNLSLNLPVSGWNNNSQTVAAEGVTRKNTVIVSPLPTSIDTWSKYGIVCTGQANGSLTFVCETEPINSVNVNGIIIENAIPEPINLVSWSTGTDEEISDMVEGYYSGELTLEQIQSVWSIGDTRDITIAAMEATDVGESHREQVVQVQILGFGHDDLTTAINGKTKALITVDLKNCLRDANVADNDGANNTEHGYMNSTNTNNGGWTSCARRTWCNNVFYNALPSYMKDLVKPVNKKTSAGNQSSTINTDSDKCFLLSEIEIFGSVTYSKSSEGSQYAWYANAAANKYKLPKWGSGLVSDRWWERSPRGSNSGGFCYVAAGGSANTGYASNARGLAPAWAL